MDENIKKGITNIKSIARLQEIKNGKLKKLCLNNKLSSEITLQPIKRFDLDAAIIFSDILMLPYGLNQKVEFKKNFGPSLGELKLNNISKLTEEDFVKKN